jgi:ADP-ribose pyrophosphatase
LTAARDAQAASPATRGAGPGADAPASVDAHLVESQIDSTRTYDGTFLQVYRDTVRLPGGGAAPREFVRHPGAVMIVPLTDDGRLVLERQYRYPLGQVLLEFPAGKLDPGESALRCAQRELLEETGYRAREWACAGRIHNAPAYSTEFIEIWLARGLVAGAQQLDEGEFIEVQLFEPDALFELAARGDLPDAKSLVALLRLQQWRTGAWTPTWQTSP